MAIKSAFTSFNRAPTHRKDVANIGTVTKWNCTFDGRGGEGIGLKRAGGRRSSSRRADWRAPFAAASAGGGASAGWWAAAPRLRRPRRVSRAAEAPCPPLRPRACRAASRPCPGRATRPRCSFVFHWFVTFLHPHLHLLPVDYALRRRLWTVGRISLYALK